MRIAITGQGIDEMDQLHRYVTQRLLFVLSRFGGAITRVGVRLVRMQTAPDAPRLGCRLTISLVSGRKIHADIADTEAHAAIDQAVERARRLVGLRLARPRVRADGMRAGVSSRESDTTPEPVDAPRGQRSKVVGSHAGSVNHKGSIR
jgi:ribosome-associated translation inhibitor RaiA